MDKRHGHPSSLAFDAVGPPIDPADLDAFQRSFGVSLPEAVRRFYLSNNGGSPDPYVFENEDLDTVVSEFLALWPIPGRSSIVSAYSRLVQDLELVQRHMLPIAVDGGGDYFFVDTSTRMGAMHFYRGDTAAEASARLVDLRCDFETFVSLLKSEYAR